LLAKWHCHRKSCLEDTGAVDNYTNDIGEDA